MAKDIVHWFAARLAQFAPPAAVQAFELEMRQAHGGQNVYVKMPRTSYRTETSHDPGVRLDPDGKRKRPK